MGSFTNLWTITAPPFSADIGISGRLGLFPYPNKRFSNIFIPGIYVEKFQHLSGFGGKGGGLTPILIATPSAFEIRF
jgi:hypothetical protein